MFFLLLLNLLVASELAEHAIINQIVEENGGKIPEPFAALKQKVKEKLEAEYRTTISMLETEFDGRSIDAKHDNHKFRRKVVSFTLPLSTSVINPQDSTGALRGLNVPVMMLGYAPTAYQVEAIEFNRNSGSYDFMARQNYGPEKQEHLKPEESLFTKEQICSSCHQAGAPIFPRAPWTETAFIESTKEKFFMGSILAQRENPLLYQFANDPFSMDSSESQKSILSRTTNLLQHSFDMTTPSIDSSVRDSNRIKQLSTICNSACNGDYQCEKLLFTLAVSKNTKINSDTLNQWRNRLMSLLQWDPKNFAYPSSVLPDRDPYLNEEQEGTTFFTAKAPTTPNEDIYSESLANQTFTIDTSLNIIGLKNFITKDRVVENPGNPLSRRPLINPVSKEEFITRLESFGAFACYGISDNELSSYAIGSEQLKNFLENAKSEEQKLLASYKGRTQLLKSLLSNQEGDAICVPCLIAEAYPTSVLNAQEVETVNTILSTAEQKIKSDSPEVFFEEFCSACHASGPVKLPLKDIAAMKAYRSQKGSPKERIQRLEMPFMGSPQAQKLTPEIREKMIQALDED